jgi:hypothetical protein
MAASIVIDAPSYLRAQIADAVSSLSLYDTCHGFPANKSIYCRGCTHRVRFWKDSEGYHVSIAARRSLDEILWTWHVAYSEAREGWPFLSACPAPITVRHDEVAA